MIPSSGCPLWRPDQPGQCRRSWSPHHARYTTSWDTISSLQCDTDCEQFAHFPARFLALGLDRCKMFRCQWRIASLASTTMVPGELEHGHDQTRACRSCPRRGVAIFVACGRGTRGRPGDQLSRAMRQETMPGLARGVPTNARCLSRRLQIGPIGPERCPSFHLERTLRCRTHPVPFPPSFSLRSSFPRRLRLCLRPWALSRSRRQPRRIQPHYPTIIDRRIGKRRNAIKSSMGFA